MARRHRDSVEKATDADDPDATTVRRGSKNADDPDVRANVDDSGAVDEGGNLDDVDDGEDVDDDDDDMDDDDLDEVVLDDDDLPADGAEDDADEAAEDEPDAGRDRTRPSRRATRFWADTGITPVEIALPRGVGLTLRHYRTVTDEDGDSAEEAVFLATEGRLHLFRSADGLVAFVRSDAEHDLTEVDGWADIVQGIEPDLVTPDEEDRYELDLVVENLRGGRDVWEPDLLIGAGEVARDVGFACGLEDVLSALSPGSPLDSLDDALRDGGFLARRKLRRIGPDQAALAWRSVIGKISMAVEWHD